MTQLQSNASSAQATAEMASDEAIEAFEMEQAIARHIADQPRERLPAHHLELARWLNDLIDEGASSVIDDPAAFKKAYAIERSQSVTELPGSSLGLAGYPDFDLSLISAPEIHGSQLVFYVQRHVSRLPLKASISLLASHLPALYEPVPGPIDHTCANGWIRA